MIAAETMTEHIVSKKKCYLSITFMVATADYTQVLRPWVRGGNRRNYFILNLFTVLETFWLFLKVQNGKCPS